MSTKKNKQDIINEILQCGADRCTDFVTDGEVYGADLHNVLYNEDYYTIGRATATEELEAFGIFDAVNIIKDYEQSNFGEVSTNLSEPEKVINMLAYIVGEIALSYSKRLQDRWDDLLTDEDLKLIHADILTLIDSPGFLNEIENL